MPLDYYDSLRERLRGETASAHAELDRLASQFDLQSVDGLVRFLSMQWVALKSLAGASREAACSAFIPDLVARAGSDLIELTGRLPAPAAALPARPHRISIDYVVAGSRVGSELLRRRWAGSTNPHVQVARAYFSAPDYLEYWKAFCQRSKSVEAHGQEQDTILSDANAIFGLFIACAQDARSSSELSHV